MKADNTRFLRAAAASRRQTTLDKVQAALQALDRERAEITFKSVAIAAGVSRSWLYADQDVKAEIERLRAAQRESGQCRPTVERASDASLHQRIRVLLDRNLELADENRKLRERLAQTLRR